MWGPISDKRTGLSFIYAAGPCQQSLSWVRVPWYSRPYLSLSLVLWRTVSRPDCLGIKHQPGLATRFLFLHGIRNTSDSYVLDSMGRLSDERTGLSFVCAAGPCQRSLSRVVVPWDLRPILLSQIWDFPFRRLLRLAGSRWIYSTPPPPSQSCRDLFLFKQISRIG
jgi:hypothetical protein